MEVNLDVLQMNKSFQEQANSSLSTVMLLDSAMRDSAKHAWFSINFFTSIVMEYVTDEIPIYLKKILWKTTKDKRQRKIQDLKVMSIPHNLH